MFNNFFENRTIYEIIWKKICRAGQAADYLRRMRFACWIQKATNTRL